MDIQGYRDTVVQGYRDTGPDTWIYVYTYTLIYMDTGLRG